MADPDRGAGGAWQAHGTRKTSPPGAEGRAWSVLVERHVWNLLEDIGFLPRERITWIKGTVPDDVVSRSTAWGTWCSAENPVLRAVAEPIYVASKLSFAREPGRSDLTADEFKAWTRNAWFIPPVLAGDANGNPAAFPAELPRRLIKLYSYRTTWSSIRSWVAARQSCRDGSRSSRLRLRHRPKRDRACALSIGACIGASFWSLMRADNCERHTGKPSGGISAGLKVLSPLLNPGDLRHDHPQLHSGALTTNFCVAVRVQGTRKESGNRIRGG